MEDNLNKIISINDIISIMSLHDYLQDFVPQCITVVKTKRVSNFTTTRIIISSGLTKYVQCTIFIQ